MSPSAAARERRELWLMTGLLAGMLLLPLAAWGAVQGYAKLQGRNRTPCHCGAHGYLRAYATSQTIYKRNDWDEDGKLTYATPFPLLATQVDSTGNPLNLIDCALAGADGWNGVPKRGYLFKDMSTIAGAPVDWERDFAFCGTPAGYGRTGYRTFIVKTDGTVWGKDLGRSELLDDFPAHPAAAGWRPVE